MPRKMTPRFKFMYLAATMMGLFTSYNTLAQQVVIVDQVTEHVIQNQQKVSGSFKARSQAKIAVRESGAVQHVLVNEGDHVKKGQSLLTLDAQRLIIQLKQAESSLIQQQASLENAQRDHVAFAASAKRNAITDIQLRQAKTKVQVQEAVVQSAAQQIELLKVRLNDMTLKAPYDGVITQRIAEPGAWLNQGAPAFELVSSGKLEAWMEVPERLVQPHSNQTTDITLVSNGQTYIGKGFKSVGKVDARSRTFYAVTLVSDPEQALLPGMSFSAWMPTAKKQKHILLDKDAVVRRNGAAMVYQVVDSPNGTVTAPVMVNVLFQHNHRVAVQAPLKQGDRVVIEGNERLMPGAPVIAKERTDEAQPEQIAQVNQH